MAVKEEPFFGAVPRWFLLSGGAVDALMGLAVLMIYFRGAQAREMYHSLPEAPEARSFKEDLKIAPGMSQKGER